MSAVSRKRRRILREATRRIAQEMPYRINYMIKLGGVLAANSLIVPNPTQVAGYYIRTGRWRF